MAKRKIRIRSGELEAWMEVTEEEYQEYYRPWWQQKKREQRNREAMEKQGYTEESYEAWREHSADDMVDHLRFRNKALKFKCRKVRR